MKIVLFASGSAGNCTLVSEGDTHILIDAGISARRIRTGLQEQGLSLEDVDGVLITHEHSDHIRGLEVLLRRAQTPVYALPPVAALLRGAVPAVRALPEGAPLQLGALDVSHFPTLHDAAASCGYRIEGAGGSFGFCTDLGRVTETVLDALRGVDCAVIEANHDQELLRTGPYPAALKRRIASDYGHLSNGAAGELAAFLAAHGARELILGHLSRENNTPATALRAVAQALAAAGCDGDVALCVAPERGPLAVEPAACASCCR